MGDTITYTITLSDNGPDAATNARVTDVLPAGVSFVSAAPSQGTYNPGIGLWSAGTVNVGALVTLVIQATATSPDPQTNTATVSHADQFDPVTTNNTATTTTTPQQADLSVAKTVDDPTPNVGDTISYTVTLTDNGPDDATNVTLQDLLPAGLSLVTAMPGQGAYDPASGIWTLVGHGG